MPIEKKSQDIWAVLDANYPSGENLTAKPALPDLSLRVFCAIDSENRRHILIQLMKEDSGYEDRQSRGIQVITRELNVHEQPPSRYLDIICLESTGYAGFDLICSELISGILNSNQPPSDIVRQVLGKWRRFWSHIPQDILSRNEIIGLIAELRFLTEKLIPEVGPAESIKRWRGPFGSRHDFEWNGGSVEVKATTSGRGRIFHINGIDQLDPPENGKLFFYGVQLREERGAEHSLPELIGTCRDLLKSDNDALVGFESALIQTGYSPHHDEEYTGMHFRIVEEVLFSVTEDFPRISARNFSDGIPKGIERIEYEINLNGYK